MKGAWEGQRDPLTALQRGDTALFEEFVCAEAITFVAFFRRLGAERSQAEDLAQDVLLRLYRLAPSYVQGGAFEALALRIARNRWIDERRRKLATARDEPAAALAVLSHDRAASERMADREEAARAREALCALSPEHRMVFELAVMQERPYAEISRELEIPLGTVKSRVFYAVRRLREILGGEAAGEPTR